MIEACDWETEGAILDCIVISFNVSSPVGYICDANRALMYSRRNFPVSSRLNYLSLLINTIYKTPMPLNIFQLNCIRVFDKSLKMISAKKSHSSLEKLCTWRKGFIVSYLNNFHYLFNLALNLLNSIRDNLILQMPKQHSFTLLWLLNLSLFLGNQIVIALIF